MPTAELRTERKSLIKRAAVLLGWFVAGVVAVIGTVLLLPYPTDWVVAGILGFLHFSVVGYEVGIYIRKWQTYARLVHYAQYDDQVCSQCSLQNSAACQDLKAQIFEDLKKGILE